MIIDDTTLPLHLHATAGNNYRTFYIFTNPGDETVKLYKCVYLYFLSLPTYLQMKMKNVFVLFSSLAIFLLLIDTGEEFFTGIIDTGEEFITGVGDTGE